MGVGDAHNTDPPGRTTGRHGWSFSIGRVSGIDIRVHWSFFLLVGIFVMAGTAPGGLGITSSLVWLVVIFACVLLHELAHCFVGRSRGAVVHEVELLPIGGVSKLEHLPEAPRDELAMAIAGPIASVAIGLGAAAIALLARVPLLPFTLYGGPLLARTFWFNLVIAAFNLLPAFPLDGGRVFRALLERRRDLLGATRIAVRVGHAIAVTLVVAGLFFNLWLVIIGVFVYLGASAEEAATIVHVRLRNQRVRDVMMLEPVVLPGDATLEELQLALRRTAQRAFPVVADGRYIGMLDDTRIRHGAPGDTAAGLAVRDSLPIDSSDLVEDDLPSLVSSPARALAVAESSGAIVGMLRVEDVQHLVADESPPHDPPDAPR
ncbi:MAG: site-2 protease family protein [Acidimicrobiia bacterium]